MKFLRLGIIAAMAMALCGQQALAADAPAANKMDEKIHAQSKMDAPALVLASGLKCDVTDAYKLGAAAAGGGALSAEVFRLRQS